MLNHGLRNRSSEAERRCKLAEKHCAACRTRFQEVWKEYELWSWDYLWAAGCEEHVAWLRAAADKEDAHVSWPGYLRHLAEKILLLEQQAEAVMYAIDVERRLAKGRTMVKSGALTEAIYQTTVEKLLAKEAEELRLLTAEEKASHLVVVSTNIVWYTSEAERAQWIPPTTWTDSTAG